MPAFVQVAQHVNLGAGPTTSSTQAYTGNTVAGNMLFAVVTWFTTGVTCSLTDSQGNTWVPIGAAPRFQNNTSSSLAQAFYALNTVGGANTVTFHWSGTGGTFQEFAVAEYSGVNAFDGYDFDGASGWINCVGASAAPASTLSGTAATHDSTELFIAYGGSTNDETWTAGNACTLRTSGSALVALEDKTVTNGTYFPAFTLGASSAWAVGSAMFYQTGVSTFVQEVNHDDGIASGATTDALTFYRNVTAGDLIFAFSLWVSNVTATIADSQGCTWFTPDGRQTQSGEFGQVFYAVAKTTGPMTVTWTYSGAGGTFIGASISEYTGVNTLNAHSVTGASSGTITATPITTTGTDLLLSAFTTAAGHQSWTNGAGYIARSTSSRSTGLQSAFAVAPGTQNATFTLAGPTNWSTWLYAFNFSSGGGGSSLVAPAYIKLQNIQNLNF